MDKYKPTVLTPELLSEIQRLHFHTRRLVDQGVTGQYKSAFRGKGIEFEEVREYMPGDDIGSIDWKVTARARKPYVKNYREERELTVMIAVDVSRSTHTGTRGQLRESLIARVGAVLTLIALNNNDKVGLVTFSDNIETYHPARKARSAVWRILHEVLTPQEYRPKTDIAMACRFLSTVLRRPSIIFLISDFCGNEFSASDFETPFAVLSKRHDVTAIIVKDPADDILPNVGMIDLKDPETGEVLLVDSGSSAVRDFYEQMAARKYAELITMLSRYRVDSIELSTADSSFISTLQGYFHARSRSKSHLKFRSLRYSSGDGDLKNV